MWCGVVSSSEHDGVARLLDRLAFALGCARVVLGCALEGQRRLLRVRAWARVRVRAGARNRVTVRVKIRLGLGLGLGVRVRALEGQRRLQLLGDDGVITR